MLMLATVTASSVLGAIHWMQRKADGSIDVVVDIPSTVMVVLAFATTLAAVWFAIQFSRTVGGELGAAFKFVTIGLLVFSLTRVDDVIKVSGYWAKWGIDYKRQLWVPHNAVLLVAFAFVAYGFSRMVRTFKV